MDLLQHLKYLAPKGYEVLTQLHAAAKTTSVEQLSADLGMPIKLTTQLLRTYRILGPHLKNTDGLSIYTLDVVARAYRRVENPTPGHLQQLLERAKKSATTEEASRVLVGMVQQWNTHVPKKPDTLNFQRTTGFDGKRRLIGALSAQRVSHMEAILHPMVARIRKANPHIPYAVAMATALYQKVTSTNVDQPDDSIKPAFLVALDDQYRYYADGKIASTDGALHDLVEVTNRRLANTGYVCVVAKDNDQVPQAVGVLPVQRLANKGQRQAAILETLICAHTDCVVPAVNCQIHHITAFKHGGVTQSPNLVALCRVHNGRNDDDPGRPKNGRIERDLTTGMPGWVRRTGDPVRLSQALIMAKGWRAWALGVYRLPSERSHTHNDECGPGDEEKAPRDTIDPSAGL